MTARNNGLLLHFKPEGRHTSNEEKKTFREFKWQGPYKVENVLPNNNYS